MIFLIVFYEKVIPPDGLQKLKVAQYQIHTVNAACQQNVYQTCPRQITVPSLPPKEIVTEGISPTL